MIRLRASASALHPWFSSLSFTHTYIYARAHAQPPKRARTLSVARSLAELWLLLLLVLLLLSGMRRRAERGAESEDGGGRVTQACQGFQDDRGRKPIGDRDALGRLKARAWVARGKRVSLV